MDDVHIAILTLALMFLPITIIPLLSGDFTTVSFILNALTNEPSDFIIILGFFMFIFFGLKASIGDKKHGK